MFYDILKRLLGNPVDRKSDRHRDTLERAIRLELRPHSSKRPEFGTIRLQSSSKPGMLQHSRMKFVGKPADTFRHLDQLLLDTIALLKRLRRLLRNLSLQIAHTNAEGANLLAEIIVKLAGEARSLILLGIDQTRA